MIVFPENIIYVGPGLRVIQIKNACRPPESIVFKRNLHSWKHAIVFTYNKTQGKGFTYGHNWFSDL
jgi:hypothetical protein